MPRKETGAALVFRAACAGWRVASLPVRDRTGDVGFVSRRNGAQRHVEQRCGNAEKRDDVDCLAHGLEALAVVDMEPIKLVAGKADVLKLHD